MHFHPVEDVDVVELFPDVLALYLIAQRLVVGDADVVRQVCGRAVLAEQEEALAAEHQVAACHQGVAGTVGLALHLLAEGLLERLVQQQDVRAVHHQHFAAGVLVRKVNFAEVDQVLLHCFAAVLGVEVGDELEGAEVVVVELVGEDGSLEGGLVDVELAGAAGAGQRLQHYLVVQVDLLDVVLDEYGEWLADFLCGVGAAAVAHVRSDSEAAALPEPGVEGGVQVDIDAGVGLDEQHVGLGLDWHQDDALVHEDDVAQDLLLLHRNQGSQGGALRVVDLEKAQLILDYNVVFDAADLLNLVLQTVVRQFVDNDGHLLLVILGDVGVVDQEEIVALADQIRKRNASIGCAFVSGILGVELALVGGQVLDDASCLFFYFKDGACWIKVAVLVYFFYPLAVVVDDVGDGLAVVEEVDRTHPNHFSLQFKPHRLREYHLPVTVHLQTQVAPNQKQLVEPVLVDEGPQAEDLFHNLNQFAAVADFDLVAELDVIDRLVHVEHSVEVAGVGGQDLHALLAVEQRYVVDGLHVAELDRTDKGAVLAADRVGLNCTGCEHVAQLYRQQAVVVEGAVDLDGLVNVGLSALDRQHSQLEALWYLDGVIGHVHALHDNGLPDGLGGELEELEVVEFGDDLFFADCEDEALVAVEEAGVLGVCVFEGLVGEVGVELAVPDEDEMLGLAHEVVAVDKDLLVEEADVLDEHALHVAEVVHLLHHQHVVAARTVAVDQSRLSVDYHNPAGLRVEVASQDLERTHQVVDDLDWVQQPGDVADALRAGEENAFLLVQRQHHPDHLAWPRVAYSQEGEFFDGDEVDLRAAPADQLVGPQLLALPAFLLREAAPQQAHRLAVEGVLHEHEALAVPQESVVLVQHQHLRELLPEAELVEDVDLRAVDLIDCAYSVVVDFGVVEDSAEAVLSEDGDAETGVVEVEAGLRGHGVMVLNCLSGQRFADWGEGGYGLEVAVREEEVLLVVGQEDLTAVWKGRRR